MQLCLECKIVILLGARTFGVFPLYPCVTSLPSTFERSFSLYQLSWHFKQILLPNHMLTKGNVSVFFQLAKWVHHASDWLHSACGYYLVHLSIQPPEDKFYFHSLTLWSCVSTHTAVYVVLVNYIVVLDNNRRAQGMQWLYAIHNYMGKGRSRYQHVIGSNYLNDSNCAGSHAKI